MKRFRDYNLSEQKKPQNMTFAQIQRDVETTIKPGHSSPMGRLEMQGDKPVVYRAQHSAQGIVGDKEGYESVDPTPLRQMHRGYAKRIRQLRGKMK